MSTCEVGQHEDVQADCAQRGLSPFGSCTTHQWGPPNPPPYLLDQRCSPSMMWGSHIQRSSLTPMRVVFTHVVLGFNPGCVTWGRSLTSLCLSISTV